MHVLTALDLRYAEHERLLRDRELARQTAAPAGTRSQSAGRIARYAAPLAWARRRG